MSLHVEDLLPEMMLEDGEGSEVASETWVTSIDHVIVVGRESAKPIRNSGGMKEEFGQERVSEGEGGDVEVSRGVELKEKERVNVNNRIEADAGRGKPTC